MRPLVSTAMKLLYSILRCTVNLTTSLDNLFSAEHSQAIFLSLLTPIIYISRSNTNEKMYKQHMTLVDPTFPPLP